MAPIKPPAARLGTYAFPPRDNPGGRQRSNAGSKGKPRSRDSLVEITGNLNLNPQPQRQPQAPWVTPTQQREQLEQDPDSGYNTQRRPPPTQARRGVGPRGPRPANVSPTPAGRGSPRSFRMDMFQGPQPLANDAFPAEPEYGRPRAENEMVVETETRGSPLTREGAQYEMEKAYDLAAKERSRQIEQQILGFLEDVPRPATNPEDEPDDTRLPPLPNKFVRKVMADASRGKMTREVRDYYLDVHRRDVRRIPGQGGQESLVEEILARDADERLRGREGTGWRPTRELGKGGQGKVILWEKVREGGAPIRLATKDMAMTTLFFQDYNSEGHLTRRLNEAGCRNVIKVLEWAYLEPLPMPMHDVSLVELPQEPKFRIAYEVADHGDLSSIVTWYEEHNLILPEAFMWHIFHSITNALCYCALGWKTSPERKPDWEEIIHGDLKPENILLTDPDVTETRMYPCAKLADFGLAYTVGNEHIRHYKSAFAYGTKGYMAPEIERIYDHRRDITHRHDGHPPAPPPRHSPGPHIDTYSLGRTMDDLLTPALSHYPSSTLTDLLNPSSPAPPTQNPTPTPNPNPINPADPFIYSSALVDCISRCMSDDPAGRPGVWELLHVTASQARWWRGWAEWEAGRGGGGGGGVGHARVLWRREERERFARDNAFRAAYRNANLGPLWDKFAGANEEEERRLGGAAGAGAGAGGGEVNSADVFYEDLMGGAAAPRKSDEGADREADVFWRLL